MRTLKQGKILEYLMAIALRLGIGLYDLIQRHGSISVTVFTISAVTSDTGSQFIFEPAPFAMLETPDQAHDFRNSPPA